MLGALMDRMLEMVCEMLASFNIAMAEAAFGNLHNLTGTISDTAAMTPDTFSGEMLFYAQSINDSVIVPIAGIILTFVAVQSLVSVVNEKNTFTDYEIQSLGKWIFMTTIAIVLITHSMDIIMGLFELGKHVTQQAMGIVGSAGGTDDPSAYVDAVSELMNQHVADREIGLLGISGLMMFVVVLSTWAAMIIVPVVVYVRFFYIYMTIAVAAIPMSTLTSHRFSGMGENYLKTIMALAFQALFMLLVIGLFELFIQRALTGENIQTVLIALGTGAALLIILMLRTESISKSIFSAH